jgi:hypothetical protein
VPEKLRPSQRSLARMGFGPPYVFNGAASVNFFQHFFKVSLLAASHILLLFPGAAIEIMKTSSRIYPFVFIENIFPKIEV